MLHFNRWQVGNVKLHFASCKKIHLISLSIPQFLLKVTVCRILVSFFNIFAVVFYFPLQYKGTAIQAESPVSPKICCIAICFTLLEYSATKTKP